MVRQRETEIDEKLTSIAELRTVPPSGPDGPPSTKKYFALVQKNSNFETHSVVSPHAHVTVYALRALSYTPFKIIDPS
jgi:hypothetical protein